MAFPTKLDMFPRRSSPAPDADDDEAPTEKLTTTIQSSQESGVEESVAIPLKPADLSPLIEISESNLRHIFTNYLVDPNLHSFVNSSLPLNRL